MLEKCKNCELERQDIYQLAVARFDKALNKAIFVSLISAVVALICVISLVLLNIKTQAFISQFECVEETSYKIEQDEGVNTAVIDSNDVEVILSGADDNKNNKKIFSQKENKGDA